MLRSQALTALFNENTDPTAPAIFFSTLSGHLIGSSTPTPHLPPSLIKKASILGTSTYAYYSEQALSVTESQDTTNGTRQSSTRSGSRSAQTQRGSEISASVSSRTSSMKYARQGYASIQPLPVLARIDWGEDAGEVQGESLLRRVIAQLGVGIFVDEGTGRVKRVSRLVAVEEIGQGLVVGVVGVEVEDVEGERGGERDGDDVEGQEEGEGEEVVVRDQNGDGNEDLDREKARRVRLLDIKTEALAEFMREEFEGFRMPKVDL